MNTIEDKLKAAVMAAALEEEAAMPRRTAGAMLRWAVPALAAASLAVALMLPKGPKDTFDSPELAYAELERTFAYISQKVETGAHIADMAEEPVTRTINTIFK